MALVPVTGGVWTFSRTPIAAVYRPELWFRPVQSEVGNGGLFAGVEVQASLNLMTGMFNVSLESDFEYEVILRWVLNPAQPLPALWAWKEVEWPFTFFPGNGGRIDDLVQNYRPGSIRAELGPPPSTANGLVWIDLTNVAADGALTYSPEGAV